MSTSPNPIANNSIADDSTRSVAIEPSCGVTAHPRLRPELRVSHGAEYNQSNYIIEDPISGKCFELGQVEAECLLACNGNRTLDEILAIQSQRDHQARALDANDLKLLLNWGISKQLLLDHSEPTIAHQQAMATTMQRARWWRWTNPISISISLGSPERLVGQCAKYLQTVFDLRWLPLALALGLAAIYSLFTHGDRFSQQSIAIWADQQWLPLLVVWICIKFFHEIAHGIVSHRYGSKVKDCGLYLILLLPLAYMDVSSSARLPNRWQRIHIAAAGMYVELILAAVATLIWVSTENVLISQWMHAIVLSAGINTLIFNANPLMRFDGYYILSDLLDIPNLAPRGRQWLLGQFQRWGLGISTPAVHSDWRKTSLIAIYGMSALAWRIMLQVTLVIAAAAIFHGLGIVMAVLAILHYLMTPAYTAWRTVRSANFRSKISPWHVSMASIVASCLIWMTFSVLSGPVSIRVPAVVRHPAEVMVRTGTDALVEQIHVQTGDLVVEGQLLVTLRNPELEVEIATLRVRLEQAKQHARAARQDRDWTVAASHSEAASSLQHQLRERLVEWESLQLKSPCDGVVAQRELQAMVGQFLPKGQSLLTIENEHKEIALSIAQDDITAIRFDQKPAVQLIFPNLPIIQAELTEILPSASEWLPAAALASSHGGPLWVKPVSADSAQPKFRRHSSAVSEQTKDWKLIRPRITGIAHVSGEMVEELPVGQTGTAFVQIKQQYLAQYVIQQTRRWLQNLVSESQAASQ